MHKWKYQCDHCSKEFTTGTGREGHERFMHISKISHFSQPNRKTKNKRGKYKDLRVQDKNLSDQNQNDEDECISDQDDEDECIPNQDQDEVLLVLEEYAPD